MMRNIHCKIATSCLAIFILFFSSIYAQVNTEWVFNIGGTGNQEQTYSIAVDNAGNTYVTGLIFSTADFDPSAAVATYTASAQGSTYIAKYDASGNYVWAKVLQSVSANAGLSIQLNSANEIVIGGYFNGTCDFDPSGATANLISGGSNDLFFAKYDNNGNYIWAKRIGGSTSDYLNSIRIDSNDNIWITGYFTSTVDFDPGAGVSTYTSNGGLDIFVAKYTTAGNYVWNKAIGGTGADQGTTLDFDSFGNIYLTGHFFGSFDFDTGAGVTTVTSSGGTDIFINKLDPTGNFIWVKTLGSTDLDYGYSIVVDASDNIYVTGQYRNTIDLDAGAGLATYTAVGGDDIYLIKYDSNGNYIWSKSVGQFTQDSGNSLALDAAGNIYLYGMFATFGGTNPIQFNPPSCPVVGQTALDIFVSKYQPNGNYDWTFTLTSTGHDFQHYRSIVIDNTNAIHVCGLFGFGSGSNSLYDPNSTSPNLFSAGDFDGFVAKYSQVATVPTSITTSPTVALTYCPGDAILVPFEALGLYTSCNSFSAQLSDVSGSFSSPLTLGTLTTSLASTHTIFGTLPSTLTAGNGYRVRVVANNPVTIGTEVNITINQGTFITQQPTAITTVCQDSFTTLSIGATGDNLTYQWQQLGGSSWTNLSSTGIYSGTNSTSLTITNPDPLVGGYAYRCVVTGNCGTRNSSVAILLSVVCNPYITTDAVTSTTLCAGDRLDVTVTFMNTTTADRYIPQLSDENGDFTNAVNLFPNVAYTNAYGTLTIPFVTIPTTTTFGTGYRIRVIAYNQVTSLTTMIGTTAPQTITIHNAPRIDAIAPIPTLCNGDSRTITAVAYGLNLTYQWQIYNGTSFVNLSDAGIYSGTLTSSLTITGVTANAIYQCVVTGYCGSVNSNMVMLNVAPCTTPTITTNALSANSICAGSTLNVTFTSSGAISTSDVYTAQLSDENGSFATAVNLVPNLAVTGAGNFTLANLTIPTTSVYGTGYKIRVVCISTTNTLTVIGTELNLTINVVPIIITQPVAGGQICEGGSKVFSVTTANTGTLNYQWQQNSGSGFINVTNTGIYSGATTPNLILNGIPISNTNSYQCVVTNLCGSVTSNAVTVDVINCNPPPVNLASTTVFNAPLSICTGNSFPVNFYSLGTYTSGNIYAVELSDVNGSFANPTNLQATLDSNLNGALVINDVVIPQGVTPGTNYHIRVTSTYPVGTFTSFGPMSVYTFPEINAGNDISIYEGGSTQLIASGADSYQWDFSNSLSCLDCADPVAYPEITELFKVTGTSDGCSAYDTVRVTVKYKVNIVIPSAFSPNGDGENDVLRVLGSGIKTMRLQIFNRWGEQVFYTENAATGWDGKYKGKDVDPGSFVYKLEATLIDSPEVTSTKGTVLLIR